MKISDIIQKVVVPSDEYFLEHRILNISIMMGIFLCLSVVFVNYFIGLSKIAIITPLIGVFVLAYCGYISIVRNEYEKGVFLTLFFLIVFILPVMFFSNGGVLGSVPYFMVMLSGLISILHRKRKRIVFVSFYIFIFAIMLILQLKYPGLIINYNSTIERLEDVSTAIFITLVLNAIMFSIVAKHYTFERRKSELLAIRLKDEISLRSKMEERIKHIAYHDPLTNLPNKRYLIDELNLAIESAQYSGSKLGLLFIDLDGFKMINDTMGHHSGDCLLIKISERIKTALRKRSDFVARIGGDEYIVVVENIETKEGIEYISQRILGSFENPIIIEQQECLVSASIGVAIFPHDGENSEELMKNADIAMYKAKGNGKNQCIFYEEVMRNSKDVKLANKFHFSMKREQFEV